MATSKNFVLILFGPQVCSRRIGRSSWRMCTGLTSRTPSRTGRPCHVKWTPPRPWRLSRPKRSRRLSPPSRRTRNEATWPRLSRMLNRKKAQKRGPLAIPRQKNRQSPRERRQVIKTEWGPRKGRLTTSRPCSPNRNVATTPATTYLPSRPLLTQSPQLAK